MTVKLAKSSIDLGIVISDSDKSLAFYRDLLGLGHEGDIPMPAGGKGVMHRLNCGDTLIKLVKYDNVPVADAGGGINQAKGYRYFTMLVTNLEQIMDACAQAGVVTAIPITEVRPGVTIAMVEDPDGNWVEFVQMS